MRPAVHLDFETASATDLRKSGAHRYAECPSTRVWGFTYAFDGGPLLRWYPGLPDPMDLLEHVAMGGLFIAHNAQFERTIWNTVVRRKYAPHWPVLHASQQSCTVARASAVGLPGDLDTLSEVLGQVNRKDRDGHALMMQLAKPLLKADGEIVWRDTPEKLERLFAYQDQDVRTEMETDSKLHMLSEREQALWVLDQTINDRGIMVDEASVIRAADVVLEAKRRADKRMKEITDGAVKKCSEVAKLVAWIQSRGINIDGLKRGDQDETIAMAGFVGDGAVRAAVELRKEAAKTSTAKYAKTLECVGTDGRVRGLLEYCGARRTGRWAGRLIQPQNYPRVDPDSDGPLVEYVFSILNKELSSSDACDMLEMAGYQPLPALSKALRGTFIAAPDHRFIGGDFSNIEGRVNAWLAGEQWKLDAFAAYDRKEGPDLYNVAYSKSFGVPVDQVTKKQRQIGKVEELALGYQGGVGAFITMGDTYGLKPYDLVKPIIEATPAQQWDDIAGNYEKATDKFGLPEDQWTAIKTIVTNWRTANSAIVQGWWDLGDAAIEAVSEPGTPVPVYGGRCKYLCADGWLYCQLPSGRVICYSNPHIRESVQVLVNRKGEEYEKIKRTVWFVGLDGVTKQWKEMYMYGGFQCENIVQAASRCLMDHAMTRVEDAGYPLVLTVHDELLSEVRNGFGSVGEFKGLMSISPDWAGGLPIAAAAWEDQRYVK